MTSSSSLKYVFLSGICWISFEIGEMESGEANNKTGSEYLIFQFEKMGQVHFSTVGRRCDGNFGLPRNLTIAVRPVSASICKKKGTEVIEVG
jgi:hypothetical protein